MMWIRRRLAVAAAAVVLALAAGLVVTLSSGHPPAVRPDSSVRLLSPFTGEPVTALRRVLTVKIDNIAQAVLCGWSWSRGPGAYLLASDLHKGPTVRISCLSDDAPPSRPALGSAEGKGALTVTAGTGDPFRRAARRPQ
jgi:hypothetical protein